MMTLPGRNAMGEAFPRGPLATAQAIHQGLRDQERAGRLMRDSQPMDNCTSQHHVEASLGTGSGDGSIQETVSFGRIAFTAEPCMTSGSRRLGLPSDPAGQPYAAATHFSVPCAAQVLSYQTNAKGLFVGATVLLFALGAVPEGFRAQVDLVFTGPAVRLGSPS